MSAEQDQLRLRHMRDASEKILAFTKGLGLTDFLADEKLQLAVIRLLEIAGEAPAVFPMNSRKSIQKYPGPRSPLRAIG